METITVKVTREHIAAADGETNMCSIGPIARALRDAVGLPQVEPRNASRFDVMVQPSRLFARGRDVMVMCDAPKDVRDRVLKWDATGKMQPFEFTVAVSRERQAPHAWLIPGWDAPQLRFTRG